MREGDAEAGRLCYRRKATMMDAAVDISGVMPAARFALGQEVVCPRGVRYEVWGVRFMGFTERSVGKPVEARFLYNLQPVGTAKDGPGPLWDWVEEQSLKAWYGSGTR